MIFLGIDPGLNGALAWYEPGGTDPYVLRVVDMPTDSVVVNGKPRQRLDLHALHLAVPTAATAVVEDVHSMPKQGVVSSFSFGFAAGAVQQAVIAAGCRMHLVPPATWKRRLGLSASKDESRALATQLFPDHAHLWAKRKHDGRAEAVLLAYYGSKFIHNN